MDISRDIYQASVDIENIVPTEKPLGHVGVFEVADSPRASTRDFLAYFSKIENAKILFGTAYSWFALDVN
jgi:PHS family inorganic phosphate transporter-like MFS transporter